jgi:hypothetical protein
MNGGLMSFLEHFIGINNFRHIDEASSSHSFMNSIIIYLIYLLN